MNIAEELDKLADEGLISSFHMIRVNGGWQAYVNTGATGSQMAKRADSPSAAFAKIIADLPASAAYDRQFGAAAVTARAIAENKPAAFELEDVPVDPEPAAAGVFD